MRIISAVFLCLLMSIFFSGGISAGNASGESALAYLKIARGARVAAMGESGVGLTDDPQVLYYNPAGIAYIQEKEISMQNIFYVESINLMHVTYVHPLDRMAFGIGIGYLDCGSMDKYDINNVQQGTFGAKDYDFTTGFSVRPVDYVGLGLNLKFIRENIDNEAVSAFSSDIGVTITDVETGFSFGVCYQNLGASVKYITDSFKQPGTIRAGFSINSRDKAVFCFEGLNYYDSGVQLRTGLEVCLYNMFFARIGYKYLSDNNPGLGDGYGITGGVGFEVKAIGVDYAITPFGDFGLTHRVSVRYRFI